MTRILFFCRYLIDVEGMWPDDAIECKYKGCHYFSLVIKFEGRNVREFLKFWKNRKVCNSFVLTYDNLLPKVYKGMYLEIARYNSLNN